MKKAEQLHKELTEKLINENFVNLHPINTFESTPKEDFETKFAEFLTEKKGDELKPIVNTEEKFNTKEESEKIPAESKAKFEGEGFQASYKVDKTLENIDSHNYDYSTTLENINNVNGQELLQGFYTEMKNNPDMTKTEIQEKVIKNLAKDPLHYVKEGQFGVEGLGYTEAKTQKADGKHAASGYSEKLKDSDNIYNLVKEHLGGVVTTGTNPWTEVVNDILNEEEEEKPLPMDEVEEVKPKKSKKAKKESLDTDLAEIDKQAQIVALEAKLDKMDEVIEGKMSRINMVSEDENLSELVDKKKMKAMQKEVKILEKRKAKMEKMYEKMAGKKYQQVEVVDEADEVDWNEKNNPTRGAAGERDPKKVGQSTSDYAINR